MQYWVHLLKKDPKKIVLILCYVVDKTICLASVCPVFFSIWLSWRLFENVFSSGDFIDIGPSIHLFVCFAVGPI